MLNGSKSYLISFTALFSKKGYELAFGVDTVIGTNREVQFLLSSPVNSTYRTLKLDVMKTATKSPYSSSSLFGKELTESVVEPVYDGMEIETVHASVVSYLSDIQRHFSGESRLDVQGKSARLRNAERLVNLTHGVEVKFTTQAENVLQAYREATNFAENIMTGSSYNENRTTLADNFKNVQVVGMTDGGYMSGVYDAQLGKFVSSSFVEVVPDANVESSLAAGITDNQLDIISSTGTRLTTDTEEAGIEDIIPTWHSLDYDLSRIEQFSDVREHLGRTAYVEGITYVVDRSLDKDAVIISASEADKLHDGNELLSIEQFTDGSLKSGSDLLIDSAVAATYGVFGESDVESMTGSLSSPQGYAAHVVEVTNGSNESQVGSTKDESISAENIKGIIADSPEISKMARLFEIMYGHSAADLVQSGMNRLVETLVQDTTQADASSITTAVIKEMEESMSRYTANGTGQLLEVAQINETMEGSMQDATESTKYTSAEGDTSYSEQGSNDGQVESIKMEQENGLVYYLGDSVNAPLEGGEQHVSKDASIQGTEMAISDSQDDVVTDATTHANLEKEYDGIVSGTEDALHFTSVDGIYPEDAETATTNTEFESVGTSTETATSMGGFEGIGQETEYADSISHSNEGTLDTYDTAWVGSETDAVEEHSENADLTSRDSLGVYELPTLSEVAPMKSESTTHVTELAENAHIVQGGVSEDAAQGVLESSGEAIVHELDEASGNSLYGGVNSYHATAYIGDSNKLAENQEQEHGVLEGKVETVIAEGTEADSSLQTDSAPPDGRTSGTRKKKVIPTNVQSGRESQRPKKAIETKVEEDEKASRVKQAISVKMEETYNANRPSRHIGTVIESPEEAKRPAKVIETVIEKPSEATLKTETKTKKKVWLILGKIASWSIWNWKKTR